jgi:hypothetical protein
MKGRGLSDIYLKEILNGRIGAKNSSTMEKFMLLSIMKYERLRRKSIA